MSEGTNPDQEHDKQELLAFKVRKIILADSDFMSLLIGRAWKQVLAASIVVVGLIGGAVAYHVNSVIDTAKTNFQDKMATLQKDFDRQEATIREDATKQVLNIQTESSNALFVARQVMTNEILKAFDEPRIKGIVEYVAANQASNMLQAQIQPKISKFEKSLDISKKQLVSFRTNSQAGMRRLEEMIENSQLVMRLLSDDRSAFDALDEKIKQGTTEKTFYIFNVMNSIANESATAAHLKFISYDWARPKQWPFNIDFAKSSLSDLDQIFKPNVPVETRNEAVILISQTKRFPERERLQYLMDVMKKDPSLRVVNTASHAVGQISGHMYNLWAYKAHYDWWDQYQKKPVEPSAKEPEPKK